MIARDGSSLVPSAPPRPPPQLSGLRQRYFDHFVPEALQGDASRLDLRRRARLFVVACHVSALLIVVSAAGRLALGKLPPPLFWAFLAPTLAAMLSGPEHLRRTKQLGRAAIAPVTATFALPLIGVEGGGLDAPVVGTLPVVPLVAAFFVGARGALFVAAGLTLEVAVLTLALHRGWITAGPEAPAAVKAALIGAYLVAGAWIARVYDTESRRVEGQLHELAQQLYEASIHDPLTGAFNRRFFAKQLTRELAYARRHGTSVSVLILDIDHFKRVNDTFGHSAGDQVLCEVAGRLKRQIREEDWLARHGGEEFVVLLRGVHQEGAAAAAERLRASVAAAPCQTQLVAIPVTISVGCATHMGGDLDEDELLSLADSRLYLAKRAGRNRVTSEGDGTPTSSGEIVLIRARPLARA